MLRFLSSRVGTTVIDQQGDEGWLKWTAGPQFRPSPAVERRYQTSRRLAHQHYPCQQHRPESSPRHPGGCQLAMGNLGCLFGQPLCRGVRTQKHAFCCLVMMIPISWGGAGSYHMILQHDYIPVENKGLSRRQLLRAGLWGIPGWANWSVISCQRSLVLDLTPAHTSEQPHSGGTLTMWTQGDPPRLRPASASHIHGQLGHGPLLPSAGAA
jgi:hypothetical protein